MPEKHSETDVLIIGAGPTGLMLALELSAHSIPYRIIDATPVRSPHTRALVLHPRSLELLSRHGVVSEFISRGHFNTGIRMFIKGAFVFEIDVADLGFDGTEYGKQLIISQAEIEEIYDRVLKERWGVQIELGSKAETVVDDGEKVTVQIKKVDGTQEVVQAKYVVGCDGAHSIIRKTAGLQFNGSAYNQDYILVDVEMKWELEDFMTITMGQDGYMSFFPMKDGVWRLICSRADADADHDGDGQPSIDDFKKMVRKMVPGEVEFGEVTWITRFRLHHRIAENYRKGRCFLAGDAAHLHSPAGGQGMNTGIQDSVNLAWKLAVMLKTPVGKEEGEVLLNSYDIERHRIGEKLLKGTDKVFEMVASRNWLFLWLRNLILPWIVPWVMNNRERRKRGFWFASQLGIRYRHSPIVGQAESWKAGLIRGGDRAPNGTLIGREGKTNLHELIGCLGNCFVLFSGVGADAVDRSHLDHAAKELAGSGYEDMATYKILSSPTKISDGAYVDEENELHRRFGMKGAGYALIRPDGHVSFIGPLNSTHELMAWMEDNYVAPQN